MRTDSNSEGTRTRLEQKSVSERGEPTRSSYTGKKKIPGDRDYSEVVKNDKVAIFSTSITKSIDMERFNDNLKHGVAVRHKFSGAKASHVKNYIKSHLEVDKPERVII